MNQEKLDSGFKISNILLVDSQFSRVANMNEDRSDSNNTFDIELKVSVKEKKVQVLETLRFKRICKGIEEITCAISMIGSFELVGDSQLSNDLDKFGRINGAAIIYPYIREHLSSLSSKAGVGVIFLPPINLTKQEIISQ